MRGVFTAHQNPGAVLLPCGGHVGAGDPSCVEEGLKVISFPRTEEHPRHELLLQALPTVCHSCAREAACSQDMVWLAQKSQQLLNTPSKLLVRTWSAVGPFSCPQAFGCPSAQWICTSWSPCCSRHAVPRTQPVCLNIGLGMAHFGFDSEAIPHAMGDTPPYRGQISENSHFHPSDCERQKNGLAEMEEV